mmetsp:Transcript_27128/g.74806  ORF Transcript_27128/g.74806 Transcript_27128/m.74806 type:complete len:105 (+) Transcript_27128:194-508(+)
MLGSSTDVPPFRTRFRERIHRYAVTTAFGDTFFFIFVSNLSVGFIQTDLSILETDPSISLSHSSRFWKKRKPFVGGSWMGPICQQRRCCLSTSSRAVKDDELQE